MTIPNSEPRFDGYSLPQDGGTFPWDFADRINRLKEASGLTWSGMARALGVDRKQLRRWCKQGVEPSGGAMLSLVRFARRFPGGLDILTGEDEQTDFQEDYEEEDDEDEEE